MNLLNNCKSPFGGLEAAVFYYFSNTPNYQRMNLSADTLTIQKFIYLLNDFHYNEFRHHLIKIKASLPLKLAEAIRARLPGFDTHEELCKKIYEAAGKTEKQNFN